MLPPGPTPPTCAVALIVLVTLSGSITHAGGDESPCPAGVVAAAGWPGEWPMPVVHVAAAVELRGRQGPCDPEPTVECAVPPGVYHPWSTAPEAKTVTVRAIVRHVAAVDTVLDRVPIAEGTVIEIHQYRGEGFCEIHIGGEAKVLICPGVFFAGKDDPFEQLPGPEVPERQLFEAQCAGGGSVWIEAEDAIFDNPAVEWGEFLGYGEVAPPDSGGFVP